MSGSCSVFGSAMRGGGGDANREAQLPDSEQVPDIQRPAARPQIYCALVIVSHHNTHLSLQVRAAGAAPTAAPTPAISHDKTSTAGGAARKIAPPAASGCHLRPGPIAARQRRGPRLAERCRPAKRQPGRARERDRGPGQRAGGVDTNREGRLRHRIGKWRALTKDERALDLTGIELELKGGVEPHEMIGVSNCIPPEQGEQAAQQIDAILRAGGVGTREEGASLL